jgi:hypothetical protein
MSFGIGITLPDSVVMNAQKKFFGAGGLGPELVDNFNDTAAWSSFGNNTVEDDAGGLKITYVDDPSGYCQLRGSTWLSTDLTIGATYKVTFNARVNQSAQLYVRLNNDDTQPISSTSSTTYEIDFIAATTALDRFWILSMAAGDILYLETMSIKEVL